MSKQQKPLQAEILDAEITEALLRSGYLLEGRIESLLRSRGFSVTTGTPIPDQFTQKPRELDLGAMKLYKFGGKTPSLVTLLLAIECVNNSQPVALFGKEPEDRDDQYEGIKVSGLPAQVFTPDADPRITFLPRYIQMSSFHHYFKGTVATQWCTFSRKKQAPFEWMAHHEEAHFESFQKLADATSYMLTHTHNDKELRTFGALHLNFIYPILVLQRDLLTVNPLAKEPVPEHIAHLQYLHQTLRDGAEETYDIDVAKESTFPALLDAIEDEIQRTMEAIVTAGPHIASTVDLVKKGLPHNWPYAKELWALGDNGG